MRRQAAGLPSGEVVVAQAELAEDAAVLDAGKVASTS
jgi:hypothetical protein